MTKGKIIEASARFRWLGNRKRTVDIYRGIIYLSPEMEVGYSGSMKVQDHLRRTATELILGIPCAENVNESKKNIAKP